MKEESFKQDIFSILKESVIFSDVPDELIWKTISDDGLTILAAQKGTFILEPRKFHKGLLFLLSGRAVVKKRTGEDTGVLMSTLTPGSIFGAVTAFGGREEYVTYVVARSACQAVLLSEALLQRLFREDVRIAENYIRYLADRIYFLNRKIDRFTESNIECRLARYLVENAIQEGEEYRVSLPYSMTDLASDLAVGRASLYRSFESLEKLEIIRRNGRLIHILNYDRLNQFGV